MSATTSGRFPNKGLEGKRNNPCDICLSDCERSFHCWWKLLGQKPSFFVCFSDLLYQFGGGIMSRSKTCKTLFHLCPIAAKLQLEVVQNATFFYLTIESELSSIP